MNVIFSPTSLFAFTRRFRRLFRATLMVAGMWSGATWEMHLKAALINLDKSDKLREIVKLFDLPHSVLNPQQGEVRVADPPSCLWELTPLDIYDFTK